MVVSFTADGPHGHAACLRKRLAAAGARVIGSVVDRARAMKKDTRRLLADQTWRLVIPLWAGAIAFPVMGVMTLIEAVTSRKRVPEAALISGGLVSIGLGCVAMLRWRARAIAGEPAEPIVHEIEIERDHRFSAACSCGWLGDDRPTAQAAILDARAHGGSIASRLKVWDDPQSDEDYELGSAWMHHATLYWDHRAYAPTCSCGWEGEETADRQAALHAARVHAGHDDVVVTDIGELQD